MIILSTFKLPSTSLSLSRILIVIGVSSSVITVSSTAIGASLIELTIKLTVAVLEVKPSLSSTV